jgi:hypothetical protein
MKPIVKSLSNNTYNIVTSAGAVYNVIGYYTSKWNWLITFICNINSSPNYIVTGTTIKNIPKHLMTTFCNLQRTK